MSRTPLSPEHSVYLTIVKTLIRPPTKKRKKKARKSNIITNDGCDDQCLFSIVNMKKG